jgi:putative membrane protein
MSSDNPRHDNNPNDATGNPEPAARESAIDSGNPATAPGVSASETGPLNRLHPISLLFDILFYVRSNIIPAIIGLSGAATGSVFGLGLAGIIFVPTVLGAVFRFLTLRYGIQNGELVVTEGLFYRRLRKVPVSKIQNIDMVQTVLHRLFQVAEVRVETASGTEAEAKLRVLSMDQVAALRGEIFRIRAGQAAVPPDLREDHAFAREQAGTVLLQIPLRWLVRAGVASGRGMIFLGLIVVAATHFTAVDVIDFERVRKIIPAGISTSETVVGSAIAIIAGLLVLRMLSIVWFILRFYGYRLSVCGKELRITCGLLTKVSATIPRRRIQFISVHRTLLMRWMGLSTIRIETAGGAGIQNEDASTTVSKRWFIPVVPDDRVAQLLGELRPGLEWAEAGFNWQPLSAMAT